MCAAFAAALVVWSRWNRAHKQARAAQTGIKTRNINHRVDHTHPSQSRLFSNRSPLSTPVSLFLLSQDLHKLHHLMTLLVFLKTLSLGCEALMFHYIDVTGHSTGASLYC